MTEIIDLQGFKAEEIAEIAVTGLLSISILKGEYKPSNRMPVKIKDGSKKDYRQLVAKVESVDKKKGIIYAVPMVSNIVDTDGEYYSNQNVKDTAHNTLKSKVVSYISDVNHDYDVQDNITMIESHVDETDPHHIKWQVALDVSKNEDLMSDLDSITGVSIWAFMKYVNAPEKKKGWIQKLKSFLKGETAESFEHEKILTTINSAIWSFRDAVIGWNEGIGTYIKTPTNESYYENVDDLTKILKSISMEKTKGDTMKKEELIELLKDDSIKATLKELLKDEVTEPTEPDTKDAEPEKTELELRIEKLEKESKLKDEKILELQKNRKTSGKTDGQKKDFAYYMKNMDEWESLSKEEQKEIREDRAKATRRS